jgi:hypothetical protein
MHMLSYMHVEQLMAEVHLLQHLQSYLNGGLLA